MADAALSADMDAAFAFLIIFYILPFFLMPVMAIGSVVWGWKIMMRGHLDRSRIHLAAGIAMMTLGVGIVLLVADYVRHPFSPTD